MKHLLLRIFPLCLILLLTVPLLVSCSVIKDKENTDASQSVSSYDEYIVNIVDLGLAENETVMEIVEVDGELRATIGVTDEVRETTYRSDFGIPYKTEYRYYDMEYVEDTARREDTLSTHEVAICNDLSTGLVMGAEPFKLITELGREVYRGAQYYFYRDGHRENDYPLLQNNEQKAGTEQPVTYNVRAHIMLHEDTIYAGIGYYSGSEWYLYVNDRMVKAPSWKPGTPECKLCGLIGIEGIPYALVRVWETDRDEQIVDTLWEETRLIPLTPNTTELPLDGMKIDGIATGGAFSDGKYGYFMCGSELWRTDGKDSSRIADLIFSGVSEASDVRSVRALSDGRILVAVDGKLLDLTGTDGTQTDKCSVFTVGAIDLYGPISDLALTFSKFNSISENAVFTVKEYPDVTSLNLALLSGEVSMVVTRDQFLLKNYVKQEFLLPLEEVAPGLFEKDVLVESIVNATQMNGSCYYLPRYFDLRMGSTKAEIMEEGKEFENRQDYYDFIIQNDPNYFKNKTKQSILMILAQDIDEWIDWESNTCHFDDGTFASMLEFCDRGGTQDEVDIYMAQQSRGNVYSSNAVLQDSIQNNDFTNVTEAKEYLDQIAGTELANEKWPTSTSHVIYPLPSSVHDGYEIFAPHYFAVVDNDESREAAGEFLQWHFLENVVEEFKSKEINCLEMERFSVNRDETDRYLARNIDGFLDTTPDPTFPADLQAYDMLVKTIHNMKCGQEQYEKTWDLISQADHFQYFRNEIFDVMLEEARRVFYNAITAEQAAEYVQNRISLYLAEQG